MNCVSLTYVGDGNIDDWVVVTLLQGVCFKGLQRYDEAETSFRSILKQ